MIGVLRGFQQYFGHITTVTACCMRRDSVRVLSAANTDAPCRRHKTRIQHPVTLSLNRANQSWFYPLNAERLARKQQVPITFGLVRPGLEPATSRLRGKRSIHSATAPVMYE